ncbi:MAG: glycosyltransferase [Lachnospiraceae bacterium]|nr:glycosyltransferase [Lachnospiraceae bacterium]
MCQKNVKKILFVGMNHEHANDMHINNVQSFLEVAQVDFFGPGYTSREKLESGLGVFWKENGGYDVLILDFSLAMLQQEYLDIRLAYHWHRYFLSDFSIYQSIRWADNIVKDAKQVEAVKLIVYQFDTHTFIEAWEKCITDLLYCGFYFWGTGIEYFPPLAENEKTKEKGGTNRYFYFCKNNGDKILSMPYCTVNPKEYFSFPLESRTYDITIPGNLDAFFYPERSKISKIMETSGYKVYDQYYERAFAYRIAKSCVSQTLYRHEEDRLLDTKLAAPCPYIDSKLTRESIVMWRENYNVALRQSKIGYACGGYIHQLFRKFVEIPARGTLLLCQDIPPLKNYGFKNWENMITVTADNILEVIDYLFKNPKEMQHIADNGRKMVYEKHTPVRQAELILNAIKSIETGTFAGSYWENGEFIVRTL